ncbi:SoxR reducing system RseC family protein [Intestinibacillus massiliensis]
MTQKAVVKKLLPGGLAEIEVQRQSACGHDCASCGGCGAPTERIQASAVNRAGAQVGETVTIEGDNKAVFRAAIMVYAVPLILFIALYAAARVLGQGEGVAALAGVAGFVVGILIAIAYNHQVKSRGATPFVIIKRS